jgi:hypothetical protein
MYNTVSIKIKTTSREEIKISGRNFIGIEYPELRITPPQDYLVVQVGANSGGFTANFAVFCLDAGFEMTWNGTLDIKDSYQSQSIGLDAGINFKIERRTYGYVNPSIPATSQSTTYYLIFPDGKGGGDSFSGSYKCTVDGSNFVLSNGSTVMRFPRNVQFKISFVPRGTIYR